jgi:hypothetical protein
MQEYTDLPKDLSNIVCEYIPEYELARIKTFSQIKEGDEHKNIVMSGCNLEKVSLHNKIFCDSNFRGIKYTDGGEYNSVAFVRVMFKKTVFRNCIFKDTTFEGCDFTTAKFIKCKFYNVIIDGGIHMLMQFRECNINGCMFNNLRMFGIKIVDSKISNSEIRSILFEIKLRKNVARIDRITVLFNRCMIEKSEITIIPCSLVRSSGTIVETFDTSYIGCAFIDTEECSNCKIVFASCRAKNSNFRNHGEHPRGGTKKDAGDNKKN